MPCPGDELADACRPPDADADADERRCAACGVDVDPMDRLPAATDPDDPSTVYLFCSDDCRDAWTDADTP